MINIVTILCIILAGVCKAGADTLMFHFDSSVFKFKDPRFWNPNVSWQYAHFLRFTKYRIDAWHLFNSGMIICFCLAAATHAPIVFSHPYSWYLWAAIPISFLVAGFLFDSAFNLFFNHVFK